MTDTQSVPPSLPHHSDSNNHSSVPTTAAPAIPTFPKLHSGPVRTLDNSGYCLLSLDGGGVRGLSTLYILRSIMWRLNSERRKAGLPPKKVCEIFDLIGGTSTGGYVWFGFSLPDRHSPWRESTAEWVTSVGRRRDMALMSEFQCHDGAIG